MQYNKFSLSGLTAFAVAQFFASSVTYAQTTQTWVSGSGDDASATCSVAAPCRTFAAALAKTAAGGEISIGGIGQFGAVTINKSVSINAVGALGSIVVPAGQNGITIAAGPTDVVILRGLTMNGAGAGVNGIQFTSGGRLHVENCTISNFTNEGILFQPTASSALQVNNVSIRSNIGGAVNIQPTVPGTAVASLNNLKAETNLRGVRAYDGSTVVVRNSVVSNSTTGTGFSGASVAGGIVDFTIENSVSSGNPSAGVSSNGANSTMRISNVTVTGNGTGLMAVNGGKILSFGNNRVNGNLSNGAPTATVSPAQM